MDSEASSSSTSAGNKKAKSTKRREKDYKLSLFDLSPEKPNHVLSNTPSPSQQGGNQGSEDESDSTSPSRTPRPKNKNKGPKRRKPSPSPVMIEDLIEGFAIQSFKTLEDIEDYAQNELDTFKIPTQGYTPTAPPTPVPPPPSATCTTPSAIVPRATSTITTDPDWSNDNMLQSMPSPLDTNLLTISTGNMTCTTTCTTSPLLHSDSSMSPGLSKTSSNKKEKIKKEGGKKSKKSLEKMPSADSITSIHSNSSKENKVQTGKSNPNKSSSSNKNANKCSSEVKLNCVGSPQSLDIKPSVIVSSENISTFSPHQTPPSLNPITPQSTFSKPSPCYDQHHISPGFAEVKVKDELQTKPEISSHTHNNNNHKLKNLSPTSKNRDHRICKNDKSLDVKPVLNARHSHYFHAPNFAPDVKSLKEPDCSKGLVRPNVIIAEEPLRQNGQSVSALSVSSLTSDRSSSRDRLSDSSSGRGYLCDSESEIESSKASDAGSDIFTANHNKNREKSLIPPILHNGAIHSFPHSLHRISSAPVISLPTPLNPAAASINTLTVPTTTPSVVAVTTAATQTKASSVTTTAISSISSSPSSSSRSRGSPHHSVHSSQRLHTPIHREQPRPIPGLSGTRPEDRDSQNLTPSIRQYWHPASVTPHHIPRSSPHISSAVPVPSLSLAGLHTTHSSIASHHHPGAPPLPPHHHPAQSTPHHGGPPHSMFAPPIAPPPVLTSNALPVHNPLGVDPISSLSASHDLLGRSAQAELNQRFIADRLGSGLPSPFLNSFHQHHHQHQHMHHYGPYGTGPGSGLLVPHHANPQLKGGPGGLIRPPPSRPDLERERMAKLDKFPKLESPLYRPGIAGIAGPLGLSPMLPPPGLPGAPPLGAGLHGAFQPKSGTPSSLHTSPLLLPGMQREREKSQPPGNPVKKSGRWCAAHVRVAWEIHIHQQEQAKSQRNPGEAKPSDLLRPPSHLLAGSSLHRPELGPPSLLGPSAHTRSPFDAGLPHHPGSLFNPSHLGVHPFPRPSPYPGLSALSTGAFGGLATMGGSFYGREMPSISGLSSPHEWNRLHRTPPSFPTPPDWPPKSEAAREREKEIGREREREKDARERERERDKERERERDRSLSREPHHHHRDEHSRESSQSKDLNRERDREYRDKDHDSLLKQSPSLRDPERRYDDRKREEHRSLDRVNRLERSRSRSPLRNGPDSVKRESSPFSRGSPHMRPDLKPKEERKDDILMLDEGRDRRLLDQRPDGLHKLDGRNHILLPPHSFSSLYPHNSVLDRRPMSGSPYDRPTSHHPALWNPFERPPLEMNHRMDLEREQLLRRMSGPLGLVSTPTSLALLEADKLREQQEILLREHVHQRDRERLALIEKDHRDRVIASLTANSDQDRSKIPPPLRPSDMYHPAFAGGLPNSAYHPSGASRPPSNSSYHHPSGASRPPSSPVVINHNSNSSSSKSNSPSVVVGAPPPLIPSNPTHNHTGSPNPNHKVKPPTPITNSIAIDMPKEKLEVNSNGLETDSQAR